MQTEQASSSSSTQQSETQQKHLPVAIIFIGMAGSGKTRVVYAFGRFLKKHHKKPYIINLDPAVSEVPYKYRIDIRDAVDYNQTMKSLVFLYNFNVLISLFIINLQFRLKLGPNGAILTCLNLFTIRFDDVINKIASHTDIEYVPLFSKDILTFILYCLFIF